MRDEALESLRALNEVVERLRAPGGCPWDADQTHHTLSPYLLEETHEVLEAIDAPGHGDLREELGDVLLQVLMHSAIAMEREDGFDIGDVADVTRTKMVHRHPHVFGDTSVSDAAEVVVNWERLKSAEKAHRLSILDGVPRSLPALAYALGVQKRPARVGFDQSNELHAAIDDLRGAVDAVAERAQKTTAPRPGQDWSVSEGEVSRSAPRAGDHQAPPPAPREVEDAVGEMLFAAVALARRLRVNPEDALRRRALEFADRFRRLEAGVRADGRTLHDVEKAEWPGLWAATAPNR
jgi:XTP/dITP diphosphohydrolase